MRIYGGRDYYDCGLALGIDPNIVLVRNGEEVDLDQAGVTIRAYRLELRWKDRNGNFTSYNPYGFSIHSITVIFCGKLYRGARISNFGNEEFIWSLAQLESWIARQSDHWIVTFDRYGNRENMTIERYFQPAPLSKDVLDYVIADRIAIMVESSVNHGEHRAIVNPSNLKLLGFAKALDPYTAFQELSMWIGGVLCGASPETVKITDDRIVAEAHGYDRHSFRSSRREG